MNPSYEAMERARREKLASLLQIGREQAVKRLGELHLCGDSHAMLSQIAYAINPYAGAWDAESCDHLRRVLAELIGGVHEAKPATQPVFACGAGGCHRGDESEAVGDLSHNTSSVRQEKETGITDELRKYVSIHETMNTAYTTMPPQMEEEPTHKGKKLLAIADKIDAQFARVCEQHEVVLQDANSIQLLAECLKPVIADNDKRVAKLEAERDDLRERLDEASAYSRNLFTQLTEVRTTLKTIRDDAAWGLAGGGVRPRSVRQEIVEVSA